MGVGGCESVWVCCWCGQLWSASFFEISWFGVGVDSYGYLVSLKFLGFLLVWNVVGQLFVGYFWVFSV